MRRLAMWGLFLQCVATVQAQMPGQWAKLAPFPEPSVEVKGAAAGGKLYVFGGVRQPGLRPKWHPV